MTENVKSPSAREEYRRLRAELEEMQRRKRCLDRVQQAVDVLTSFSANTCTRFIADPKRGPLRVDAVRVQPNSKANPSEKLERRIRILPPPDAAQSLPDEEWVPGRYRLVDDADVGQKLQKREQAGNDSRYVDASPAQIEGVYDVMECACTPAALAPEQFKIVPLPEEEPPVTPEGLVLAGIVVLGAIEGARGT